MITRLAPALVRLSTCQATAALDFGMLPEHWLSADEGQLLTEARAHYGSCDDGDLDPADLRWRLVIDLPTSILLPLMTNQQRWREWFDEELAHSLYAGAYRSLMDEPLNDPIVTTIEPHRVQIWDGWHRSASRILGGAAAIPAIVGFHDDLHEALGHHIAASGL